MSKYYALLATLGILICMGALFALMQGPGGLNPWSITCGALIAAGLIMGIVFWFKSSRDIETCRHDISW